MKVFIHATADVSSEANIGENTKVWHLAQIREGASIGENCIISKNVYVDTGVRIGNNVKIQNNVNIYNGVIIEDDVFLGPSMTFTNDLFPRSTNANWVITKTVVKKGASIGANATVVCGVTIGKYAMVGAGAVVTKDVHDYTLVVGNPAKTTGRVCKCGVKLADASNRCNSCGFEI
jgi:acetyltransferase-like isoleucine patch superfamily enzyme